MPDYEKPTDREGNECDEKKRSSETSARLSGDTTRFHRADRSDRAPFIAQSDPGPSIYRDMYAAGQGGFHHVCALVPMDDWDRQLRVFLEAGYEIASSLMTSAPAVYLDCRADLGCFVELYGRTERSEGFFAHLRDLHEGWDGITDPIRQR